MNMEKKNNKFKFLVIVTFICLAIMLTKKVFQNDTFYTIKVGESILENGIDMKEHFAWTEGLEYTYPHWLYDSFIYLVYDLFGFNGIYVSTILLTFILLSTMYITTNKIIKDKGISYILVLFLSLTLRAYMAARAQLVSYIFFVLIVYSIEKLRETNNKKYSLYILLSSLLIANAHCAVWPFIFVLFMPFLGSDLIYFIKKKYKDKLKKYEEEHELYDNRIEIEKAKNTKSLIITFLLTIVTGFLTPNFLVPFTYLIKTNMGITMSNISEHLPQTINGKPQLFIILGLIVFVLLQAKMKIKLRDLFFIGGLALLALLSKRSYALFAILLIYSFGRIACNYIHNRTNIKIENVLTNNVIFTTFFILMACSAFVIGKNELKKDYVDEAKYPKQLSNYILKELDIDNMRLYNEYNFGSYLLYRGIPVYYDSRADLYTEEFNKGCTIFKDGVGISGKYKEVFKKYGITHVVISNNSYLKALLELDTNYLSIYQDEYFTLYENLSA